MSGCVKTRAFVGLWAEEPGPGGLGQNFSGFVSPNVVKDLVLQLFDPGPEPCGGFIENIKCGRIVAAAVCLEGAFVEGFDPLYV
jgi:hypothetical protein